MHSNGAASVPVRATIGGRSNTASRSGAKSIVRTLRAARLTPRSVPHNGTNVFNVDKPRPSFHPGAPVSGVSTTARRDSDIAVPAPWLLDLLQRVRTFLRQLNVLPRMCLSIRTR